jgi:catechol 2,3-dioxygenase-like lactoylglutathione lyase family enzyme
MRLQLTVIDTPDPERSATFYGALLGLGVERTASSPDWVQLEGEAEGVATLAFQRVPDLTPPTWPEGAQPQRLHLDLEVDDLDAGEEQALAAGARKASTQPGSTFRVFLDPIGHPFCLVLARGAR